MRDELGSERGAEHDENEEMTFGPVSDGRERLETIPESPNSMKRAKRLSKDDIEMHKSGKLGAEGFEDDPISVLLPDDARLKYLAVSAEIRRYLVEGLRSVERWQNSPRNIDPVFHENDLGHVTELLAWCNEIEQNYPDLYREICDGKRDVWNELLAMTIVHDIGEIKLGDVVVPNQDSGDGLRRKRIEPRWGRYQLYKAFGVEEAEDLVDLYDRFEDPADDDKVALLARAMDKGQASANVARHIIGFNEDTVDYLRYEFIGSQSDTLSYVERLMPILQSDQAKEQLHQFFMEHVVEHFDAFENNLTDILRTLVRNKFPNSFLINP